MPDKASTHTLFVSDIHLSEARPRIKRLFLDFLSGPAQQAEALRPRRRALRRIWGVADDAFCVLFCGKFIAKKRPLDLIAAAARAEAPKTRKAGAKD